ncbi:MAG: ABC transporter permease [Ignavibacteria bacterium GWA2_55_11]|nr:MAG: ABC transporter permease [Ignavibacteria bacterium GWA2_55_11]OGU63613.1 MAG: ABC transporter permease [Ignavibacteria bacterium RIFCSPHIGHO2_02_FULL_56_12]OGU73202.1 MAG: ABC transporter permease [Ignavibacteria bacterium RIFCSPLOWO2_02_FULL_55_14]OGU74586.1 MAG: ABC transporter permease [Ignavibacteria bacterium RIFCSPLOWO2_12_FULL_56_21]
MNYIRMSAIVIITYVLISGIAIPIVPQPQGWFEFPVIPGLEEKARNIFFHVPTAWTTVVAFLVSMWYGLRYLRTRNMDDDLKSEASAGLGFMFCVLATITGALWAKFNWGSFWNWDPRETSIFILLLIYGAYFALRSAIEVEETRARLSAVYATLAGLTVPFFIFVLPRIVSGLHPGAKGDPEGAGPVVEFKMSPSMLVVFILGLIGFNLLYVWLLNVRVRTARLEYRRSTPQG